jgi:hypothetical protein
VSWALTGLWVSQGFQSGTEKSKALVQETATQIQHCFLVSCSPGLPPDQLADAQPLYRACWLAGCLRWPLTRHVLRPHTLTLGFFTPLPLGCSSESCRFLDLFSAGGVSTKLESWGSGVAFSPKGSDWWRETSRVATGASSLGTPVIQNLLARPPYSYSSKSTESWDAGGEHWALLPPATCNSAGSGKLTPPS